MNRVEKRIRNFDQSQFDTSDKSMWDLVRRNHKKLEKMREKVYEYRKEVSLMTTIGAFKHLTGVDINEELDDIDNVLTGCEGHRKPWERAQVMMMILQKRVRDELRGTDFLDFELPE